MPRPSKPRPISVTVFWSESSAQWIGFLPLVDAKGNPVKDAKGNQKRAKRTSGKPGPEGKQECEDKIRVLEDEQAAAITLAAANVPTASKVYRAHAWIDYWLWKVKYPKVSYNMFRDYRLTAEHLIKPHLDDCDFPELESSAIELMLERISKKHPGRTDKPNRAYRHLRMALGLAAKRPKETGLWHNPILSVDMPFHESPEAQPYTPAETKLVLASARRRPRNSARWTIGWAFGLRPGEALGLSRPGFYLVDPETGARVPEDQWYTVDLDKVLGVLEISESVYRRKWEHGCKDPHDCGKQFHKYPCPKRGEKHKRHKEKGCPAIKKPCPPNCTGHAAQCESRHGGIAADGTVMPGGQVRKPPKSRKGKRKLYLPSGPTRELLGHLREQDKEKEAAGDRWLSSGALFASKLGGIINERDDYGEYVEIVEGTELAYKRPYDGRHAAATGMLIKKVSGKAVKDAMGWASDSMLDRYQHLVLEMRREATGAITELLWDDDGYATDLDTEAGLATVTDIRSRRPKVA